MSAVVGPADTIVTCDVPACTSTCIVSATAWATQRAARSLVARGWGSHRVEIHKPDASIERHTHFCPRHVR